MQEFFDKNYRKREFTIIYCRRYLSIIENHISVSNELFSKSNALSTVKTAEMFPKHFSPGLPLCILYFFFHKGKNTSVIKCLPFFSPFS